MNNRRVFESISLSLYNKLCEEGLRYSLLNNTWYQISDIFHHDNYLVVFVTEEIIKHGFLNDGKRWL